MSHQKKQPPGCGCSNIPISVILLLLGGGYWWFSKNGVPDINSLLSKIKGETIQTSTAIPTPTPILPASPIVSNPSLPKVKLCNKN